MWEICGSPFYCLNEFDVFKDEVNRDVSMKLLVDAALNPHETRRQYILISPLGTSSSWDRNSVKEIRMADPGHCFIVLFLTSCIRHMDRLKLEFVRGRSVTGHKVAPDEREKLNASRNLNMDELDQVVKDIEAVNKNSEKICKACLRTKDRCPELVASGGSFSSCSACNKVGRKVLYCSRACQIKDFAGHKKICGKPLASVPSTAVPVFATRLKMPSYRRYPSPSWGNKTSSCGIMARLARCRSKESSSPS